MKMRKITPSEYEALPWCHVHGSNKNSGHHFVKIIGTENGLREIIRACEAAIKSGKAEGQIHHCGGEGSGLEVRRTNLTGLRAAYGGDHD